MYPMAKIRINKQGRFVAKLLHSYIIKRQLKLYSQEVYRLSDEIILVTSWHGMVPLWLDTALKGYGICKSGN
jgi:hypothetical protein